MAFMDWLKGKGESYPGGYESLAGTKPDGGSYSDPVGNDAFNRWEALSMLGKTIQDSVDIYRGGKGGVLDDYLERKQAAQNKKIELLDKIEQRKEKKEEKKELIQRNLDDYDSSYARIKEVLDPDVGKELDKRAKTLRNKVMYGDIHSGTAYNKLQSYIKDIGDERFDADVDKYISVDESVDDDYMLNKYPLRLNKTKYEQLQNSRLKNTPLDMVEGFKDSWPMDFRAIGNKKIAHISKEAREVINKIKNEYDWKKYLSKWKKLKEAGLITKGDHEAILEYFGKTEEK